jgi:CheY-like chemotaxis protein
VARPDKSARRRDDTVDFCRGETLDMARVPARILLVEDVEDIRLATAETLSRAGYEVSAAADALEALVLLAREPAPDVLFTDIVLGSGMNGYALAERALQAKQDLKVLYTSGYPGMARDKPAGAPTARLLLKPYRAADIIQALAQLL